MTELSIEDSFRYVNENGSKWLDTTFLCR